MSGIELAKQLTLESANSPFDLGGGLTADAIANSQMIIPANEIGNPLVPAGYAKYTTTTYASPSGNFKVHFYMNPSTGAVYYGLDYKVVFNTALSNR